MTDLILPAQLTSELEAVNVLITSMGESPFTSITPSPSPDVDKALAALNETNRSIQSRGWNWNREYNWQTTISFPTVGGVVQTTGPIYLPPNTLRMVRAYAPSGQSWNPGQYKPIVARGQQLYDQQCHSYNFSYAPQVDLIVLLEWALLPEAARKVIVYEAVELFQSRDQMASPTLTVNAKAKAAAWTTLEQQEDEEAHWNAVYGNLETLGQVVGNMGMRRNRSPY